MSSKGKVILENIDQNRDQWLALRKGKVSSSNIAIIAGLSQWQSPLELWAKWTGKVPDTFTGNRNTRLGNLLEPFAAELYSERTGKRVERANALYQHPEYDWAIASPDYFIKEADGEQILEIKTGNHRQVDKWKNRQVDDYVAQVQWQLGVIGLSQGVLSPFLGLDFEEEHDTTIEFDAELFAMFFELASNFLDLVRKDIPPNAGAGDSSVIHKIIKRHKGKSVELSLDAAYLVAQIHDINKKSEPLKDSLKELDVQRKERENQLKVMMGDASIGVLPDGREVKVSVTNVPEKLHSAYSFDRVYLPKN